jgi:hypothetical protein
MSRPRVFALTLAVLLCVGAIAVVIWLWPYSAANYQGDGTIADTGFWSYPRYHIRFPQVSLASPGEHQFTCRGLPPESLTLELRLVETGQYEQLRKLKTRVEFTLTDDAGKTICEAAGPLSAWVLAWMPAHDTGYFWQPACRDFNVSRRKRYQLTLVAKDVDPQSPPVLVEPMLTGGGNELP